MIGFVLSLAACGRPTTARHWGANKAMSKTQSNPFGGYRSSPTAVVQLYDTICCMSAAHPKPPRKGDFQVQFDEVMNATRIVDGLIAVSI